MSLNCAGLRNNTTLPHHGAAILIAALLAGCSDGGQNTLHAPASTPADDVPETVQSGPEAPPSESLATALSRGDELDAGELNQLLAQNDEALSQLLPDFQQQSFNDTFERRLFDTLGRLGSDAAQQLLADVLTDPFVTDEQRFRSLMALRQVAAGLNDETLTRMMDYALDIGVTLEDDSFRNDTLLALGEVAAEDSAVASLLTDALRSTTNLDRIATLLTAIGNARLPDLETELSLYLSRDNAVIRARAAYALGNLQSETATAILLDQLAREQDQTVAVTILQRLDANELTQAGIETIIRFALEYPDAEGKVAALQTINGAALPESSILLLEDLQRESTEQAVIDAVGRVLRSDIIF